MKIDLPITIIFDCQDFRSVLGYQTKNFIPHVCTLRFDDMDEGALIELFDHYPPESAPDYPSCEDGAAILSLLKQPEWQKIVARARRSPYDYGVGTEEERTIAQAEADLQAEMDGPP